MKITLTRLGIFNFVITIVGKELFENDNSTTFLLLISNILCKIVVNDLLNNQNILKDIFEDKRGQRRENVKIRLEFFES